VDYKTPSYRRLHIASHELPTPPFPPLLSRGRPHPYPPSIRLRIILIVSSILVSGNTNPPPISSVANHKSQKRTANRERHQINDESNNGDNHEDLPHHPLPQTHLYCRTFDGDAVPRHCLHLLDLHNPQLDLRLHLVPHLGFEMDTQMEQKTTQTSCVKAGNCLCSYWTSFHQDLGGSHLRACEGPGCSQSSCFLHR
jgi:hypothetical protein